MKTGTIIVIAAAFIAGCASQADEDRGFFTSGNREADQRAEQRMAKAEQTSPKQASDEQKPSEKAAAGDPRKLTLYARLGGEKGVRAIIDDFVARAMADPRVNWERKGVTRGGFINRNKSIEWTADADKLGKLKEHLTQFVTVAAGGPAKYAGREMKQVHEGMHITNAEFDASVGDLKATLDKLQVPDAEQKELLAIIESTREQVVEKR